MASDQWLWILLGLLECPNGERMRSVPCATTDWSVDATDHQSPAQPVGSGRACRHPRAARRAGPGGPPAGRPGVVGTVPGPLRPSRWSTVDPDRDLPADDVLEVPLSAGYELLCREVADSISWQRFCRIPLGGQVPHATTLVKLTRRVGPATAAPLNQPLLAKAATHKVLRTHKVRGDTTVVEAGVCYPTDAGLLAKAVSKLAHTIGRVQAAGGPPAPRCGTAAGPPAAAPTSSPGRCGPAPASQTAGRRAHCRAGRLGRAGRRRRHPGGPQRPPAACPRWQPGLRQAGQAVEDLETTIGRTGQVIGQARTRLAGQVPDGATRLVSLHDPDARRSSRAGWASRWSSATRPRWSTTPTGSCWTTWSRSATPRMRHCWSPLSSGSASRPAGCPGRRPPTGATARPPSTTSCTPWAWSGSRSPARAPPAPPARPTSTPAASGGWSSGAPAPKAASATSSSAMAGTGP